MTSAFPLDSGDMAIPLPAWLARFLLLLTAAVGCQAPGDAAREAAMEGPTLALMTFNIRYGTAQDGEHVWPARRSRVAASIQEQQPDVLAIQEGLAFQLAELEEEVLQGYRKVGQHRDGGDRGEFSGLYLREETVQLLGWGELWLSPTPEVVGSRGWDAALPRMAVWADVQPRAGGSAVRVYGTHFDHRGAEARWQSSRTILRDAGHLPQVVVMGDFNALEEAAPLRAFFEQGWISAIATLHPEDTRGTFNGYRDPTGGRRIDHILSIGLELLSADILSGPVDGLYPSDHDAVIARIAL